jgi:hypothetical protein
MQDLRRLSRSPVQRPGMLHFENGTTYPCIVTDISGLGAKISLLRSQEFPPEFVLSIDGNKSHVRIVWRTRFHLGVQFLSIDSK